MHKMVNILFSVLLIIMFSESKVLGGQIDLKFKKALWPNTYYLIIDNSNSDRVIEFQGGWEKDNSKTNYSVVMNDEKRFYFSSPIFKDIGFKGRFWINQGEVKKISFKLPKEAIKNGKEIVFNGFSYIPKNDNGIYDEQDRRTLMIIYNISQNVFNIKLGDEPIKGETNMILLGNGNGYQEKENKEYKLNLPNSKFSME